MIRMRPTHTNTRTAHHRTGRSARARQDVEAAKRSLSGRTGVLPASAELASDLIRRHPRAAIIAAFAGGLLAVRFGLLSKLARGGATLAAGHMAKSAVAPPSPAAVHPSA